MNKKAIAFVSFALGSAFGVLLSMKYFDEKYSKIADDEIESVKKVFSVPKKYVDERENEEPTHYANDNDGDNKVTEARISYRTEKADIKAYMDLACKSRYVSIDDKLTDKTNGSPYTISPNEFGELEDYDKISLTFYSDGVLANDLDQVIDEGSYDETVGSDFVDGFGEYEEDSVYVRNDKLKRDYEILRDSRHFSDVVSG